MSYMIHISYIIYHIYDNHLDRGKFTKQCKSVTAEHRHGEVHPFDDLVDVDHDHGRILEFE